MGLLKKKQQRPTSILISKNPTGLAIKDNDVPDSPSASSLLAAQAAALTFKTQSKNSSKPILSAQSSSGYIKPSIPQRAIHKQSPPTQKSTIYQQKRNSVVLPTSNIYLDNLSSSDVESHKTTLPMSRGRSDKRNSISNIASLQAASVAAARSISTDFLAPPVPLSASSRNASSTRAASVVSSVPSIHSFDSLPLFNKLQLMDSNFDSQEDLSTDTHFRGFDMDELDDEENENSEYDSTNFEDFDYYGKSDDSSIEQRQLSPVHEVNSPGFQYELNTSHAENVLPSKDIPSEIPRTLSRKPPPASPSNDISPESSGLSSPPQEYSSTFKRGNSPRRKPPPDLLRRASDSGASFTHGYDSTNHSHDSLPQYPLTAEELKRTKDLDKKHKEHRRLPSHGFRKSASKILKRGLKVTSDQTKQSNASDSDLSLKPKPVQLKTTMRKEKKPQFNEEKPWKHHVEGEFITEQERKRYEGVWVSNKGLYLDKIDPSFLNPITDESQVNPALRASMLSTNTEQTLESNLMLNLVVKELWGRSHLPDERLRKIWELVDIDRKDGTLDKKGFLVGMWLVDQCLYGRKLPKVVDRKVWDSVSNMGVNVVIKTKRKK